MPSSHPIFARIPLPALAVLGLLILPSAGPALPPARVAADVDRHIDKRLAEAKIPASPQTDDAEFLRRVTLDLIGRIPTADEAVAFLGNKTADKRARAIDDLLARPEYGRHFGILWHNRIIPLSPENTREFKNDLFVWLADGFNRNRPWGETVAGLLLAEGDVKAPRRRPASASWAPDMPPSGSITSRRKRPARRHQPGRLRHAQRQLEAQAEFDEAADWYEQQADLGAAFTLAVREMLNRIAATPLMHQVVYQDIRRAVVRRFPYTVFYRVDPDRVTVIAVFNNRRDHSIWQGRA